MADNGIQNPLVRDIKDLPEESWNDERGTVAWRTLFSADSTPASHMVTGVGILAEGGFLALHRHEQAETYYLLSGTGTFTLNGQEHLVHPGSTVFIPGGAEHGIRNDNTETLTFFYALATDRFTDVQYKFS